VIGLGAILMALGLADLVAGDLVGQPTNLRRVGQGLAVAVLILLSTCWVTGLGLLASSILLALTIVGCGWMPLRISQSLADETPNEKEKRVVRLWWALGILGATLAITIVSSGEFRPTRQSLLSRTLENLDLPLLATLESGRFVLLVGSGVFLVASTNGIVRAVLDIAGTKLKPSEQFLRGGRLIGAIERFLIYGLAVVGEPTAAALIVSAKSLLRFPELSKVATESRGDKESDDRQGGEPGKATAVDYVTEYFLLGSLVSWFVALALALLMLEPTPRP